MQPPARGRPTKPGRGRGPARWTPWEVALIIVSVLMIAFPLYAGTTRLIFPPVAPAQESTPEPAASPTNDPVFPGTEVPSDTPEPPPSETSVTAPSETSVTAPSATSGTAPSATSGTAPSETSGTAPSATSGTAPSATSGTAPSSTPDPSIEQGPTRTPTTTPSASPTSASPTVVGTPPTATNTTVGTPPTATTTAGPATGVRVFKVASVSEAAPGQQFSYSISVVTDSPTNSQVSLSDGIDGNLELLSASTGSGSCSTSGQSVSCDLTLSDVNPAQVTIQVRVRADVAAGTTISNDASAGSATSGTVSIRVIAAPPTSTTGPTVTGTPPTAVPPTVTGTPPTATTAPPPTVAPPPPPTNTRTTTEGSGDRGNGGGSNNPPPVVAPPAPPTPDPNALPTEPPTAGPDTSRPQVLPTAAIRPTRVVIAPTNTPSNLIPIVDPSASATSVGTAGPGGGSGGTGDVFFRLASDWGAVYPGQQVNFTLAVRNTRSPAAGGANDLRNLAVRSVLPDNLEVLGADADRGSDPTQNGNEVTYSLPLLQPGEGVEILIASRVRPNVTAGTILVTQGQLTYDGLTQGLFSNIVTVQVVGNAQQTAAPLLTATVRPPYPGPATATPGGPTATSGVGATATSGTAATATRTSTPGALPPTQTPVIIQPQPPAPLPETSAGVPFLGILLLGMTLFTRTWRLHRAKERL